MIRTKDIDRILDQPRVGMTQWDFAADIGGLLERPGRGEGPESMPGMVAATQNVVAHTDSETLHRWLEDNAQLVVGQQILVASVHAQRSAPSELPRVLREWAATADQPTPGEAVDWLKQQHPALLRAWLLSRVDELVAAELART